jgi:hypothetical protein
MLHPSLYFPDYPGPASGSERRADSPKDAGIAARIQGRKPDFQRIVLPSGCVLIRMVAPKNQP